MVALRFCCQVMLVSHLVGCAGDSGASSGPASSGAESSGAAPAPAGPLDFGWRLSGHRDVAPLQVFSDARQTWLQWNPGQSLPAILAAGADGERVLAYSRQEPYTVIEGHWPELVFRAGARQANARRRGRVPSRGIASVESRRLTPVTTPNTTPDTTPDASPPAAQRTTGSEQRPLGESPLTGGGDSFGPTRAAYAVTPDDIYLRQALTRWTGLSGWRFQPEHWAVDVDVPISAGDTFGDDFVPAVQALLATTELSDRPLQPCFYSNQVLRVVSASELCDRTAAPGDPT